LTRPVVIGPADRFNHQERRNEERGATFSMIVPLAVLELASDLWGPPDDAERAARAAPPDDELAAWAAPPA
jgi:hypothetical protein